MPFDDDSKKLSPKETATTCPYCGVGCGVLVTPSEDGQSAKIEGDEKHPSNFGRLCSKGSALGETLTFEERLLNPIVHGKEENWDTALDLVAGRFAQTIAEHGPDSVAFYVSGQCLTEDYYIANKLMKGFIGSSNIDTNSRLCMASSVAGHKRAFGTDTVPGCYEDLDLSDLVILVGSNFAWCHPVLHQRLLSAKEQRGTKIVVIDPRETATTEAADLHLAIKSGADVALFNALFAHLASSDVYNTEFVAEHTEGMAKALVTAQSVSLEKTAKVTGLTIEQLKSFFDLVTNTERTMTVYSQGVNQSSAGTDKVNAILNCHLVTGRIGKPGMGPFSITGQPNAMGGREVGGLANQLAVHMDFDPVSLDKVQRFWDAPNLSQGQGLKAVDMFDAIADGKIKALWVMATNPAVSMPNADKVSQAIADCPFVVVSDVVDSSDTVKLADVKLPATGWGEKTGTVTNSERRISRQRSFLKPAGQARHDWDIMCDVARRMGFDGFDFEGTDEVFKEYAAMSAFENNGSRDFDIGGLENISKTEYNELEPFQWPLPSKREATDAPKRFFADGQFYTPNKKARFIDTPFRDTQTRTNAEFDVVLNTGRIRDHWHTMTRTGKTQRLSTHNAEPFLELNLYDADRLGLKDADIAVVKSKWGSAHLRVVVTDRLSKGSAFAPIHWTERFSSKGCIDGVVGPYVDPVSGQPEMKFTPVTVRKMRLNWWSYLVSDVEPDYELLSKSSYWAVARRGDGWSVEFAGETSGLEMESYFQALAKSADQEEVLSYSDSQNGNLRRAVLSPTGELKSYVIVSCQGPVEADRAWLGQTLGKAIDAQTRLSLLAGRPPLGQASGKIICSCMGIGSGEINKAICAGADTVAAVGCKTSAGTNCGSCKPEIAKLLSDYFEAQEKDQMEAAE